MAHKIISIIFGVFLVIMTFSCANNKNAPSFIFSDTADNIYNSETIKDDFLKVYSLELDPNIVLILTSDVDRSEYVNQVRNLYNIRKTEERSIIFVTASLKQDYRNGYFTDKETTMSLFKNRTKDFHVLLISSNGKLIKETDTPISSIQIEELFPIQKEE